MSSLWDGSAGDWVTSTPDRETLALSVAAKVATIVAIVALIVALWAMTSPQARTQTDATLGPPMGNNTQLGQGGPGAQVTTVDAR